MQKPSLSIRQIATVRQVSDKKVQKVKKAMVVLVAFLSLVSCSNERQYKDLKVTSVDVPKGLDFKICFNQPINNLYYKADFVTTSGKAFKREGVLASKSLEECFTERKMQLKTTAYSPEELVFYEDSLTSINLRSLSYSIYSTDRMDKDNVLAEGDIEFKQNLSIDSQRQAQIDSALFLQEIAIVEKEFWNNLKAVDKDQRTNYFQKFKNAFTKNKMHPYDFYSAIKNIHIEAEKKAIQKARALGFKDRAYVNYMGDFSKPNEDELLKRLGLNFREYRAFDSNYCSCFKGKNSPYCNSEGDCILEQYFK